MKMISFFVDAIPKAQPRPKVATRGKFAHAYYPKSKSGELEYFKSEVMRLAKQKAPESPWDTPCVLRLLYYMPRTVELQKAKHLPKDIAHVKKPDWDNLGKLISDALSQAGVWSDDAVVYDAEVAKVYAPDGCPSGVQITIETDGSPYIDISLIEERMNVTRPARIDP